MTIFDRLFHRAEGVEVSYNTSRHVVEISMDETVSELRRRCTFCQNGRFLYRGRILEDDKTLGSYGMKPGSRVLCTGPRIAKKNDIDGLMQEIKALEPEVKKYVQAPDSTTHDRLAEVLLQKLFALDGLTCDGTEEEKNALRAKRKTGVKYAQSLLDEVDAAN